MKKSVNRESYLVLMVDTVIFLPIDRHVVSIHPHLLGSPSNLFWIQLLRLGKKFRERKFRFAINKQDPNIINSKSPLKCKLMYPSNLNLLKFLMIER